MIDPNDFIITRKRKKYKFAKFANAPNCFEFEQWQGQAPSQVAAVEIGAGTGKLMVELASLYPGTNFAALDVKADRLQKGAYEALSQGLDNVYFIRARADQVSELFSPNSLQAIWLAFSDPFPKKRNAGRRMTHPTFLAKYDELLGQDNKQNDDTSYSPKGLLIKHDNPDFFEWSLEQLVAEGWRIEELSFNLHESTLSMDHKIMTTYEERWLEEGRVTQFARASR